MKRNACRAALVALAAIVLPLTLFQPSNAAIFGHQVTSSPSNGAHLVQVGQCWQRMGPYFTQNQAYNMIQQAQARGYTTGPVYGEGGLYSNYSNRRWFFRVYYPC